MACDIFSIACVCMLGAFVAFICVRRPNLIFFTLHYITLHVQNDQFFAEWDVKL